MLKEALEVALGSMAFLVKEEEVDVVALVIHGMFSRAFQGSCRAKPTSRTTESEKSYVDADGKTQTRTVTHHHRNSGGSRGRDGRDGSRPKHILTEGSDGRDGSGSISVVSDNGTKHSYIARYHLVVKSFEVFDENRDGVYEPGEYLIVKNIVVHNEGEPQPNIQFHALLTDACSRSNAIPVW
jgi:hypothetical protein